MSQLIKKPAGCLSRTGEDLNASLKGGAFQFAGTDSAPATTGNTGQGWFKAMRGGDALELLSANPLAYVLASVIAHRARWREGFSRHGLGQGEAMLGDYKRCGMTQQQYRTAKAQLTEWHFATFRATNKGTVGKLMDSRLFSTSPDDEQRTSNEQKTIKHGVATQKSTSQTTNKGTAERLMESGLSSTATGDSNEPSNERLTNKQRTSQRLRKNLRREEGKERGAPDFSNLQDWQLRKDTERLSREIEHERTRGLPDEERLTAMRAERRALKAESERRYTTERPDGEALEEKTGATEGAFSFAEIIEAFVEPKATDEAKAISAATTLPPERQQPITATTGPPATTDAPTVKPKVPSLADAIAFVNGLSYRPDAPQVATEWHAEFAVNPRPDWRKSLSAKLLGRKGTR